MKSKLITLIFINLFLFSHEGHSHKREPIGSVFGSIVDSLTNKPIEYVSVSIISEESNEVISGNITDSFGKFRINDIDPGRYYLKLEFMGYKNKFVLKLKILIYKL